jgi:hypothetical protein
MTPSFSLGGGPIFSDLHNTLFSTPSTQSGFILLIERIIFRNPVSLRYRFAFSVTAKDDIARSVIDQLADLLGFPFVLPSVVVNGISFSVEQFPNGFALSVDCPSCAAVGFNAKYIDRRYAMICYRLDRKRECGVRAVFAAASL